MNVCIPLNRSGENVLVGVGRRKVVATRCFSATPADLYRRPLSLLNRRNKPLLNNVYSGPPRTSAVPQAVVLAQKQRRT
eukprot:gene8988-9922_t